MYILGTKVYFTHFQVQNNRSILLFITIVSLFSSTQELTNNTWMQFSSCPFVLTRLSLCAPPKRKKNTNCSLLPPTVGHAVLWGACESAFLEKIVCSRWLRHLFSLTTALILAREAELDNKKYLPRAINKTIYPTGILRQASSEKHHQYET